MSAPSESAASPAPCACTNISLMQLFHELKQKFPGVPDHVVSNTIELYCHDKQACEKHLHSEVKASLTHAYHASSSAAARQLNQLKLNPPLKCRNQPIVKHEALKPTVVKCLPIPGPQKGILSAAFEKENTPNTDANQNIVETKNEVIVNNHTSTSPITVINIDNCHVKYNADSPSDLELTNENLKENTHNEITQEKVQEQPETTNYKIQKSNKIKNNLYERLEKGKEKKTIKKEEVKKEDPPKQVPLEKQNRPKTLDFIKPNPDIAFKQTLKEPQPETCRTVSPVPSSLKNDQPVKEVKPTYCQDRGYPVNVSVNVNCHMDLSRGYTDPWLEEYGSPRAITSVNLTVCTPTSNMSSPIRDTREEDGGFEGHVTVTVSPSTTRPVRRRAPPPPQQPSRIESPRPSRAAPEPPGSTHDRSLIERQKERLGRLAMALAQERGRLGQLNRETQILAGPPPTLSAAQRLRDYVDRLREQCNTLAKKLEMSGNEPEDADNFYSNIYTGQRPPSSWQCHMCTFRNHPLLDKCEECDMPRIFVGTSPPRTHDSGFGSFRDRTRSGLRVTNLSDVMVERSRSTPQLNC